MGGPLVVCLLLHPTQRVQLFVSMFPPCNSSGNWAVCVKILERNAKGFLMTMQVKWKGIEELSYLDQYLVYLGTIQYMAIAENGRRIGIRMRSAECHFQ